MSWKVAFEAGIKCYRGGQYEQALEAFNKAIHDNNESKTLFDSRAAVLEALGRPFDALKDSKKVIGIAPESWQGYTRSARLFLQIGRPAASLKMVDLALERLKSSDVKRRAEVEALRVQAIKALEPPPCHFSKLPVELQVEIFTLVIDESNAKMLALMLVCRVWREIIIETAKFWRHLVLTSKTTMKKACIWFQRCRGTLSSLRIASGCSFSERPNVFRDVSDTIWSMLDALDITHDHGSIETVLPPRAFEQLRLQSFRLETENLSGSVSLALANMVTSRTRRLVLKIKYVTAPLTGFSFSGLTHLHLRGGFPESQVMLLASQNVKLETLIIELERDASHDWRDGAESFELTNLKCLRLSTRRPDAWLRNLRYPNIESLHLERALGNIGEFCITEILSQRPICLKELSLHYCTIAIDQLISLLQCTPALGTLSLSRCNTIMDDMSSVINALSEPVNIAEGHITQQVLCCPRLQHIDISSSPHLKALPIVRLVKARLNSMPKCSDDGTVATPQTNDPERQPLPIISLNIDDCPMVDSNALPWLRANVSYLSCKITPVKMGRGQR